MASKEFSVIRDTDGLVLLTVVADTEYGGARVIYFDAWTDAAHLERFAGVFGEAATWLRSNQ